MLLIFNYRPSLRKRGRPDRNISREFFAATLWTFGLLTVTSVMTARIPNRILWLRLRAKLEVSVQEVETSSLN